MELVLADTLLSQRLDSGALLRAVCGEDGALSVDRAETLRFLLQRVAATEKGCWRGQGEEGAAARRLAEEAALGHCLPALLRAGGCSAAELPEEQLRLVRASCGALRCCASLGGPPLAERLAQEALESLEAGAGAGKLWTEAAVEVLAAVAPWLEEPALLGRTVGVALRLLRGDGEDDESRALLVAGRLLPALGRNHAALGHVWEGLMLMPEGATPRVSRTLLVLSALSDAVFPASAQQQDGGGSVGETARLLDARLHSSFWKVVQKGLTESDAPCRKRARYLLKRAVDVSTKLHAECRCTADAGNGTYLAPVLAAILA